MEKEKNIKIISSNLLSDNWGELRKVKYDFKLNDGTWQQQEREVYDRGNGAVILLYNKEKGTVILTRQLRIPTWFNGNEDGMMIEACAGVLDENDPEECIKRETQEETGYKITEVKKIMEVYMSPGSVTEIIYFFTGAYADDMKISEGGGVEGEYENIEVLEIPFTQALQMVESGEIKDAKTIMLLQYAKINDLV
ncbi:GDP-mannose pyrophosphatase NudK [Flavobacterium alkalisoli]|uniref:GDP-mannose pyrophosphatase NudK n=1 Tax=Flavobacterium alkalisoli TaxID=2602769 RepID=UPI003A8E7683